MGLIVALVLAGLGLTVGGVFVLFGPGWTLLAGGAACLLLAGIAARGGVTHG